MPLVRIKQQRKFILWQTDTILCPRLLEFGAMTVDTGNPWVVFLHVVMALHAGLTSSHVPLVWLVAEDTLGVGMGVCEVQPLR